jgi:vacuolar protein 8
MTRGPPMIHPAKEEEEEGIAKSSSASNWAETKQVNSLFQLCTAPKNVGRERSADNPVSMSGLSSYLVAWACALKKNTVGKVCVHDTTHMILVDRIASVASKEFPLWSLVVDKTKTAVTVAACVQPLVSELCRCGDDDAVAKANAAGVLCGLVARYSGKVWNYRATANAVAIAKAGAISPLVWLCQSGDTRGKKHAAHALCLLAYWNAANTVAIAKAGAIGPLVELCRSGDAGGKRSAAAALQNLAHLNADNKVAIAKAGAIGPLVELCRSGGAGGKRRAAGALQNLAHSNAANAVAIGKAGAIGPLVELCRSGDAGGKLRAAGALQNLAYKNADSKVAIAKAGAIGPLVELRRSGDAGGKLRAAGALWNLAAENADNKVAIAKAGGAK